MVKRSMGRGWRVGLGVAGVLVVLLVAAQLVLPGIAAQRMRERVGRYGQVLGAHVSAFPALELLWGQASSASVQASALQMSAKQASELLWSARGIDSLDVSAENLLVEPLRLRQVSVKKRGSAVRVLATLTLADLRAALPAGVQVQALGGGGEGQLELSVGGELFGISASVVAVVQALEGKLVAVPRGLPLGGLAQVTLFSGSHLSIDSATFKPLPGAAQSWRVNLAATQS